MRIITGIDIPFEPSCGSMIICNDIYSKLDLFHDIRFFSLKSNKTDKNWSSIKNVEILNLEKEVDFLNYNIYIENIYSLLLERIDDFTPDIIHLQHLTFGLTSAFMRLNRPKIAICHGTDILYALNFTFHLNTVENVCRESTYIVFPSEGIYKDFTNIFGDKFKKKSKIIKWGIPLLDIKKRSFIKKGKKFNILYAGRLSYDKNVALLINILPLLPTDIHLTIIGEGEEQARLHLLSNQLKINHRVTFEKFKSRNDLWKSFPYYSLLIIPSSKIEAFGLVALEAQAHSLPIVYSNVSGLSTVFNDSGIPFDVNNPLDLVDKIQKLYTNSDLLLEYNVKSIENASLYPIDITVNQLNSLMA